VIRSSRRLAALAALLACSACAPDVGDSGRTLVVDTVPVGAACELTRDGATLTRLAETPGTVQVPNAPGELRVTCRKPGYRTRSTILTHCVETGALGSLSDAVIGAGTGYPTEVLLRLLPEPGHDAPAPAWEARGARSGAAGARPPEAPDNRRGTAPAAAPLRLTPWIRAAPDAGPGVEPADPAAPPHHDPGAAERAFADRKAAVRAQAAQAVQRIRSTCGDPDRKPVCAEAIRIVERRRDARLARIEADHALSATRSGL
jgi:hypothetical protein